MRLILTGGGTGGHIYPALVVGDVAAAVGDEILYFGSLRGQESKLCQDRSIPFRGFPSEPLYSVRTLRGLKALVKLQQARIQARKALRDVSPDVVFSTGGYSAGSVVAAARDLRIPYTIHTADSVPARSSSMFAKEAAAFTCTFRSTVAKCPALKPIRTGQPIRKELRTAAKGLQGSGNQVFVVGGSQGSEFLNQTVPLAAVQTSRTQRFMHASGPKNFESTMARVEELGLSDRYTVVPYLDTEGMVEAFKSAGLVIARSGGTVAELALFGLPSILVPLPNSANDHQLHNAEEFVDMNAASLLIQSEATPDRFSSEMTAWLSDGTRRDAAKAALLDWDVPDAANRIYSHILEASR